MKLASKILIATLPLVVLPIVLLSYFSTYNNVSVFEKNLNASTQTSMRLNHLRVSEFLNTAKRDTQLFAQNSLLKRYFNEVNEELRAYLYYPGILELFAGYALAKPEYVGFAVVLPGQAPEIVYQVRGLALEPLIQQAEIAWSGQGADVPNLQHIAKVGDNNDLTVAIVSQKIMLTGDLSTGKGLNPEYRGHIILVVSLDMLEDQVASTQISDQGFIFFTDEDADPITNSSPPQRLPKGVLQQARQAVLDAANTSEISLYQSTAGNLYHKKLDNKLHLFSFIPTSDFAGNSGNILAMAIAITLLSIMLVSLIIYRSLHKLVFRPVQSLMQGLTALPSEGMRNPIPVVSNDELGELSNAYNSMLKELGVSTVTKRYMQNILMHMRDAVVVTDPEGRILFTNQTLLSILDYRESDLLDKPISLLLAEDSRKKINASIKDDPLGYISPDILDETEWLLRSDGQAVPVLLSLAKLTSDIGQGNLVFTATDISQRLKQEQELISAREVAENANAAKSEFLSRMSHELRTPLNAIIGFSQLQLYDESLDQEARGNLNLILEAGEHLLVLVNDILDIVRLEQNRITIDLENCSLEKAVMESIALVQPLAQKQKVKITSTNLNFWVLAQHARLVQVVINLLTNAIKYNVPEGDVIVTAQKDSGYICIDVIDTGIGIVEEQIEQVFEPFKRLASKLESKIEGTGIGLTLTKYLVERMGGTIQVQSKLDAGTKISVRLPAVKEESGSLSELPAIRFPGFESKPAKNLTVLYIEDNRPSQMLVGALLNKIGNITFYAPRTGEEGIKMAASTLPDLVIVDIGLPGIGGIETLARLKQNKALRNCKFIALSADATEQAINQAMAAGFSQYLLKPLDIKQLTDVIDSLR